MSKIDLSKYGLAVSDPQKANATRRGLMQVFGRLMSAGATTTDPGHFAKEMGKIGGDWSGGYDSSTDKSMRQNLMGYQLGREADRDKIAKEDRDTRLRLASEKRDREVGVSNWAAKALRPSGMMGSDMKNFGYTDPPEGAALPLFLAKQQHERDLEVAQQKAANPSGRAASPIQNFKEYQRLVEIHGANSPEVNRFEAFVRAPKWIDMGGSHVKPSLSEPGTAQATVAKTLAPSQTPEHHGKVAFAKAAQAERGKEHGEAGAKLSAMEASMPRLDAAVLKLSELGKKATYTKAGQVRDVALRETGQDVGAGAIARASYMAHVKANILPLLKQTFGAQFTVAEGDSLLATLGSPDMHPREKDAVLEAFIENKWAEVMSLRRQTQGHGSVPQAALPMPGKPSSALIHKYGLTPKGKK